MFNQMTNWDEAIRRWRVRLEQIEGILAGPNCNIATPHTRRLIETKQHLERQIAEVERACAARAIKKSTVSPIEEPDGIPKLELIEPLLTMFIGQTIEPISSWMKANEGPHTGLIADFINAPGAVGRRSIPARGVIARVVYRGTHERLTVNSCCWLEQSQQRIDFEPGEMHRLVLAVMTEGDKRVFTLKNRRGQIPVDGSDDPGIIACPFGKLPFKVELVLIDEKGRTVFKTEFLLERDKNKIIGARKIELARSDAAAVIDGGGTGRIVAEKAVHLTSTVHKTVPTNTDLALKSLEPSEGTKADLEVAKDSTGIIEQKTNRGPKAKMELHRAVAAVVHSFGPKWKEHLDQIAGKLDKHKPKLPPPAAWALKNPSARSWGRAVAYYPDLVLKKLDYALKMAARDTTRETFANSR